MEITMPTPLPVSVLPAIDCHAQAKIDAKRPHPNKKKIFIFCDGTGNEFADTRDSKEGNSNVVKLYMTLRIADNQVAYYHPGVGTMGDPSIRHAIPRFWSKVKGLAFGSGFKANVLDAYRYLMEVYNDGDDIYIFGFSRGAYTARALAGMLYGCGLLCRGNEGHIPYAWNIFHDAVKDKRNLMKKAPHARGEKSPHAIERNFAFAQTYSRKVTVRFMGIWDTVSSVGWIYAPVRLLDMAQNPIIQVGRHAVSIDERRAFYRDNLWGPPVGIDHPEWPSELRDQGIHQDLAQVWFPGAHSDVGGSYPQWEAAPANEALRWMIGELKNHGAELCQDRVDMVLGKPNGNHSAGDIFTPPPDPDHRIHDSLKGPWLVLQLFPQQHYDKEDAKIEWRVPYGRARTIPKGAIIHGSAIRRIEDTIQGQEPYRPRNLKRDQCEPLSSPPVNTTADLTGCYVLEPKRAGSIKSDSTAVRMAKLAIGWITFGIFWLVIGIAAWYVLSLFCLAVFLAFKLIAHTPGILWLYHWVLSAYHSVLGHLGL
jgi:uncharacterized protein (DUF2235 family)